MDIELRAHAAKLQVILNPEEMERLRSLTDDLIPSGQTGIQPRTALTLVKYARDKIIDAVVKRLSS
jgi:predicted DNA-binding protein (UPF0251 family)